MCELEQEQFRRFRRLNGMDTENSEEIVSTNEEPNDSTSA